MKNFGKLGYVGNPFRTPINHPLADTISYFEEPSAEDCFEAAFFKNGQWVVDIIPELSEWAEDDFGSGSRVYRYVPKEVVQNLFIE
jgi:hypothetical protein